MMYPEDVREFAGRVEKMCNFFIGKYRDEHRRDGSKDLVALEQLAEDAADIATGKTSIMFAAIDGLAEAIR